MSIAPPKEHLELGAKVIFHKTWEAQQGMCFYTGDIMDFSAKKKRYPHINFPSVDRKVPSLGYTKQNVVWCRYGVNRSKNDLTDLEFVEMCKKVVSLHG